MGFRIKGKEIVSGRVIKTTSNKATRSSASSGLKGVVNSVARTITGRYGFGRVKKVGSVSQRGNIFGN